MGIDLELKPSATLGTELEAKPRATTEATARDFAGSVKSAAGNWIGSADAKATALVAVAGAVFAIVLSGTATVSASLKKFELSMIGIFSVLMMCSIIGAAAVLWPRTNREKILRKSGHATPLARSPSFFGDISKMSYKEFKALAESPPTLGIEDPLEQAYVTAKIASLKMCWMKVSVFFLIYSLITLGLLVFIEVILRWRGVS